MGQESFSSPQDLLSCFFEECETCFRYLEQDHSFVYFSGLADYRGGRQIINPFRGQTIKEPFHALTRYEKGVSAVEIVFAQDRFALEGFVSYDGVDRFSLSEILGAAKKSDALLECKTGLHEKALLLSHIRPLSQALKQHINLFVRLDPDITGKAIKMRGKMLQETIRRQFKENFKTSTRMAAEAFRKKDYRSVITLLRPYEHYLDRSARQKFEKSLEQLTT